MAATRPVNSGPGPSTHASVSCVVSGDPWCVSKSAILYQRVKETIPLPLPRRFLSFCGIPRPPACVWQADGCGQPSGSFPHVPTAAGELRSVPRNSDSALGPPAAAGRDGREDRATAGVQNDGNGDSASSDLEGALGDEAEGSDSWRWDDSAAGRWEDGWDLH